MRNLLLIISFEKMYSKSFSLYFLQEEGFFLIRSVVKRGTDQSLYYTQSKATSARQVQRLLCIPLNNTFFKSVLLGWAGL